MTLKYIPRFSPLLATDIRYKNGQEMYILFAVVLWRKFTKCALLDTDWTRVHRVECRSAHVPSHLQMSLHILHKQLVKNVKVDDMETLSFCSILLFYFRTPEFSFILCHFQLFLLLLFFFHHMCFLFFFTFSKFLYSVPDRISYLLDFLLHCLSSTEPLALA